MFGVRRCLARLCCSVWPSLDSGGGGSRSQKRGGVGHWGQAIACIPAHSSLHTAKAWFAGAQELRNYLISTKIDSRLPLYYSSPLSDLVGWYVAQTQCSFLIHAGSVLWHYFSFLFFLSLLEKSKENTQGISRGVTFIFS